jgi:ABC-2 type transport system permease protein
MIFDVARMTFLHIIRDGRFQTTAALLLVLFIISFVGAFDHFNELKAHHENASRVMRLQWDHQADKNPHAAAHYGTYVFKPVYPLSFFDRGVDDYTGNTLFLEGHRANLPVNRSAADQNDFFRLGILTPAFILGLALPLLIILLGFGSVSSERENGNLRLLLAQGLPRKSLFWGKSLGLWAVVTVLVVPFFLIGAAGLILADTNGEQWLRYLLLMLFYFAYFGCFIHLTLLISAVAGRQNAALVGSISIWVVLCLLLPRLAVNVVKDQYPVPTRLAYNKAMIQDLQNGVDGHDGSDVFTQKLLEETLKQYGVASVDQLPFNWTGYVLQKGEEHETYVYQKHRDKLLEIYQQQETLHQIAAFCSPYLLISNISRKCSGTDVASYFAFLKAAEQYRITLVGTLNNDLTQNFRYGDWGGKRGKEFFGQNPRFDYAPPGIGSLPAALLGSLGILLFWFAISGLAAWFSFEQLKPL